MSKDLSESITKAFLWSEELSHSYRKEDKEIFLAKNEASFLKVEARLTEIGITAKYSEDFGENIPFKEMEDWMRSKNAVAIYSPEENGAFRERALEFNLIVMTSEETVRAFSMMTNKTVDIVGIHELERANQKEVVFL